MTVQLLHGDCRDVLRTLADGSVHCCITSPPYWGLRSYLPAGHPDKAREIGSEPTVHEWVRTMVEVFREVRRVLRPDGTLWLNLGDSYATGAGRVGAHPGGGKDGERARECAPATPLNRMPMPGFKPKDLIGQPWRVAFALQEDGWWLRQELIWAKKNPMPESVRDRFTKAHEQVFLLSKSERYWFDLAAVMEPAQEWSGRAATLDRSGNAVAEHIIPGQSAAQHRARKSGNKERKPASARGVPVDTDGKSNGAVAGSVPWEGTTKQPRSIRWLASEPFRGAHFATYPPELIRPFVLAGCPEGGTVLDPFGGSGTTGLVADRHHRNAILIDIDERNLPMARDRIHGDAPLFSEVAAA